MELSPAETVFAIPELRALILYTHGGLRAPTATAIIAGAHAWAAQRRGSGARRPSPDDYGWYADFSTEGPELHSFTEQSLRWWTRADATAPTRRNPGLPGVLAFLRARSPPDASDMGRWQDLYHSGCQADWRPPKPCGIGLTVGYPRSRLLVIAAGACPPDAQPNPAWDTARIVRHILAH